MTEAKNAATTEGSDADLAHLADHEANREALSRAAESGFLTEYQVYEPHRVGLPPLRAYITELWRRREFAARAVADQHAGRQHPHLLRPGVAGAQPAAAGGRLLHAVTNILAQPGERRSLLRPPGGRIFAFYYVSGGITTGAQSVVGRWLADRQHGLPAPALPLSAVRTAFFRFLPTLPVYLVIHVLAPSQPVYLEDAAGAGLPGCMIVVFSAGAGRDLRRRSRSTSATRRASCRTSCGSGSTSRRCSGSSRRCRSARVAPLMKFNPLYSLLGGWSDLLVARRRPAGQHLGRRRWPGPSRPSSSARCSSCPGSVSSLSASDTQSTTAPVAAKAAEARCATAAGADRAAGRQGPERLDHLPDHLRADADAQERDRAPRPRRARRARGQGGQARLASRSPRAPSLGIVGANGAGKSTLMRAIGGHPAADRGAHRGPRPRQHAARARRRLQPPACPAARTSSSAGSRPA